MPGLVDLRSVGWDHSLTEEIAVGVVRAGLILKDSWTNGFQST